MYMLLGTPSSNKIDPKIETMSAHMLVLILDTYTSLCWFQEQSQLMSADHMRGGNMASLAAMEQTRMLANTLAQNEDPKFQVFLIFTCIHVPP